MRILVVSDSHGNKQILNELAEKYGDEVDAFVHCGDSELPSDDLIWEMMDTVRGNCDYDGGYDELFISRKLSQHYAIVHGHRHDVKWSLEPLKDLARKAEVPIVFYGHSHILKFDYKDGIYFINPGSIQSPRGDLRERTYCILSVESNRLVIEVFRHNHEKLESLTFKSDKLIKL
ncbi:YfcE family phosphodiesterase [Jeotgalibaca sp. A122]|uniref:YfcE family phosphodiesterase n=1 Tax=Jeotgalibaca sp. A122 TaxID=3457322 RepID=UPI003FD407F3